MFERMSNDEISSALDELITCVGIKEDRPIDDLEALVRDNNMEGCVQEIATQFDLPIRIRLSYVSKDYNASNEAGFSSSSLVQTDNNGRGIEGITAQVLLPEYIPMFGTSDLKGYPIQVRISENCLRHPDTFVAIIAHEISHVLLASLWSPHKNSELHTELISIILGFRESVRWARKAVESSTSGDTITIHSTKYGYLTDAQFDFACNYVTRLLQKHAIKKNRLLKNVERLQRKLEEAARSLATFRDYFKYLDRHPPKKMKEKHAQRVVALHAKDYSRDWDSRISEIRTTQEVTESFVRSVNHYTSTVLETHTRALEAASDQLDQVTQTIRTDKKILRKYVGIINRLRRVLQQHS